MRRGARRVGLTGVALACFAWAGAFGLEAERDGSVASRVLGSFAPLLARVQWVRVEAAVHEGRWDLALLRAERALELDPGATVGWVRVGTMLALDLAGRVREEDPERAAELVRAGLAVLERGTEQAREPERLREWRLVLADSR